MPLLSSSQVLFLERRENSVSTATLMTTGSEGSIRAWSVCGGGLLGHFTATRGVHESVISMTTDQDNTILVTGDTAGFVKVAKTSCLPSVTDLVQGPMGPSIQTLARNITN